LAENIFKVPPKSEPKTNEILVEKEKNWKDITRKSPSDPASPIRNFFNKEISTKKLL
jgi:hypothetical protein